MGNVQKRQQIRRVSSPSVMSSYNLINGIHSANARELLTVIARVEWGFEGVVMSDCLTTSSMGEIFGKGTKYSKSSAAMCIHAGNDLIMPGSEEDLTEILDSYYGRKEAVAGITFLMCKRESTNVGSRFFRLEEK